MGHLRDRGDVHGRDGRVGLRGLGQRLVLPAVLRRLLRRLPVLRGYYPTYGYGASYNPWTGAYSRGAVAYGPYGGAGVGARYNPRTGTYSRGAAAYGPYGSRAAGQAYNPRTGTYAPGAPGSNVYGSWGGGTGPARRPVGPDRARDEQPDGRPRRARRAPTAAAGAVTRRGPGRGLGVVRTGSGDVYAGRDGNVYRKQGGGWQKYDNGSWGSADRPTPTGERATQAGTRAGDAGPTSTTRDRSTQSGPPAPRGNSTMEQLDRDYGARSEGTQRTRDYGSYQRSGGGRSSSSSYRGGGGARRGRRTATLTPATDASRSEEDSMVKMRRGIVRVVALGLGLAVGGEAPRAAAQAPSDSRTRKSVYGKLDSVSKRHNGVVMISDDNKRLAWKFDASVIEEIEKVAPGNPMIVIYRQISPNDKRVTAVAFPGTAQKPTYKNLTGERVMLRSAPLVNGACGPADPATVQESTIPRDGLAEATDGCWCCAIPGPELRPGEQVR